MIVGKYFYFSFDNRVCFSLSLNNWKVLLFLSMCPRDVHLGLSSMQISIFFNLE
jgi:hypothetical protein